MKITALYTIATCPTLLVPCKIPYSYTERLGEGITKRVKWKEIWLFLCPLSAPLLASGQYLKHSTHPAHCAYHSLLSPVSQEGQHPGLRLSDKAWLVPRGTGTSLLLLAVGFEPEGMERCVSGSTHSPDHWTGSLPGKMGPVLQHKQSCILKPYHHYAHIVSHRHALTKQPFLH